VQHIDVSPESVHAFAGAANRALDVLRERMSRLSDTGKLGHRPLDAAVWEFHALCEGLATLEARCHFNDVDAERLWYDALSALVHGWERDDLWMNQSPSVIDAR
jgi:hypothetical protein